jgi:Phage integrase family
MLSWPTISSDSTPDNDQALVFTSPMGTPLRHSSFYRRAWLPAVAKVGLPGIHFHDLRHAGNTLTADAGASLRELMDRMGHSSTRAALIYQHPVRRKAAEARRCGRRGRPGSTPQDGDIIWHTRGTRGQRAIVNVGRRSGYVSSEQVFQKARPAGFEPATRCLEGTFEPSRDVVRRRLTSLLTAVTVARCRRMSRGVCLHWLPYWLLKI